MLSNIGKINYRVFFSAFLVLCQSVVPLLKKTPLNCQINEFGKSHSISLVVTEGDIMLVRRYALSLAPPQAACSCLYVSEEDVILGIYA